MAIKVFLGSGDTFTASNAGMSIFGGAGTQTVLLNSAATTETLDANIERVDLSGALSTYTFNTANGLTNIMSGTTVVASFASLNQNVTLAFTDGSATLAQTGATAFTLGGQAITTSTTAAAITSASMGTSWSTTTTSGVTGTGGGATGGTGSTFVLTSGVDYNMQGTTGNDTFIADNSTGLNAVTSIADNITGNGGVDTLKMYLKTGAGSGTNFPTMTGITNLYINNADVGVTGAGAINVSALSIKALEVDGHAVATATTYTVKGQSVQLDNTALAAVDVVTADAGDTAQTIGLNNVAGTTAASGLTVNGAGLTSVTINSLGTTANNIGVAAGARGLTLPAGATTLNLSGSNALTIAEVAATAASVKTINASTATGAMTVDTTAGTKNAAFAFTGGSGGDKLILKAGDLAALTAGSQLDGGAGTDTLATTDVTANITSAWYTAVKAVKNFEVLSFNGAGATVIDASQLTGAASAGMANHFAIGSGQSLTVNNEANNSIFDINVAGGTLVIGTPVGVTTGNINLNTSAGAGFTTTAVTTTGLSTVNINSAGDGTVANAITTLTNSDNTTFKVTGSNDLTFALSAGTTTGDKVDGSTFTGKLSVTGSAKGDVLIGGSGADTFTVGAGQTTLTGGAGADTFNVNAGVYGAGGVMDVITDFTKGTDKLTMKATGTDAWTSTALAIGTQTSEANAINAGINLLATGTTNGQIGWFTYGGNAYVVESSSATHATVAATDIVVKLTGVTDLSTLALTGATLA